MVLKKPSISLPASLNNERQLKFETTSPDKPKASPLCVKKRKSNVTLLTTQKIETKRPRSKTKSRSIKKARTKDNQVPTRKRKRLSEEDKARKKRKQRESKYKREIRQPSKQIKFVKDLCNLEDALQEKEIELEEKEQELQEKEEEITKHLANISEKKREVHSLGETNHSQQKQIQRIKDQNAKQILELKKKTVELTRQHSEALEKKERSLQERFEKENARNKAERSKLEERHRIQVDEVRKELKEERDRKQSELDTLRKTHGEEKSQQQSVHQEALESLRQIHEKEKTRHKEEIERIQKMHEQEKTRHKEEIDEARKLHGEQTIQEKQEREKLRKEIETRHKVEVEAIRKIHEEEKSRHKSETDDLRQKHDVLVEKEKTRHKEELAHLRETHVEEIKRQAEKVENMRQMYEQKLLDERENERVRGIEAQKKIESGLEKMTNEKKHYEAQYLEGQKQLWQVQEKIKLLEKEKNSLQESHMRLESSNRTKLGVLENENEALKKEVKANIKEMDDTRLKEKTLNEKVLQMEVMKSELLRQIEVMKSDLQRQKDIEATLRAENSEKQSQLSDVKIDLAVAKNNLETSELQTKREEENLKQRIKEIQHSLEKAESRNEKLEEKVEGLNLKLGEASSNQNKLETLDFQKKRDAEILQQRMQDLQEQLEKSEQKNGKLEKKVEELNLKLGEASSTQSKLETLDLQKKQEAEALKQRLQDLQQQFQKAEQRNAKLEEKLEEAEVKIREASSTHNEMAIEKEKLMVQLSHTAELQSKLNEEKSALQKNLTEMSGDVTMKRAERERMMQELAEMKTLKQRVQDQQQEIARLKGRTMGEMDSVRGENVSLKQRLKFLENKNVELEQTIKELRWKQHEDMKIRRKLHNKIIELKGNIRVFCRVRPFLMTEEPTGVFKFPSYEKIDVKTDSGVNSYEFNRIFQPTDTQEDVFIEVQEVVQSALDGYNVCLFAYGQTSSGKTYTMEGANLVDHKRGLIPRSVEKIFAEIKDFQLRGWEYEIKMSALQIYNEDIFDLLATAEERKKLKLQFGKEKDVKIVDLKQVIVTCPQDVHPLLKEANRNRATSSTDANAQSSRSHSVFTLYLKGQNAQTRESMSSRLCLVDLAGSERLKHSNAQGDRLRETQNINKSLHHLKTVIKEIGGKSKHIGYRNSKLTSVLRPSLAGESKVLMILNLCPGKTLLNESLLSLRFGCEASQVEVGRARKNVKKSSH